MSSLSIFSNRAGGCLDKSRAQFLKYDLVLVISTVGALANLTAPGLSTLK